MGNDERALRAVRAMNEFEMLSAAADASHAVHARRGLQRQTLTLQQHCEDLAQQLRASMSRDRLDPALLDSMGRLVRAELDTLRDWQAQLISAERREDAALTALAQLRGKERSLDAAVRVAQANANSQRQTSEMNSVDDLWLQRRVRAHR